MAKPRSASPFSPEFQEIMDATAADLETAARELSTEKKPLSMAQVDESGVGKVINLTLLGQGVMVPTSEREAFFRLMQTMLAVKCRQCGVRPEDVKTAEGYLEQLAGAERTPQLVRTIREAIAHSTNGKAMCC